MFERAARDGWLWWLTPDEDLRLVHATARPAIPPGLPGCWPSPVNPNVATAILDGVIDVHGSSTEKVELRRTGTISIDDPAAGGPPASPRDDCADYRIEATRTVLVADLQQQAEVVGDRHVGACPSVTAIHTLPDTKAHIVFVPSARLVAVSRVLQPEELPDANDELSAGNAFSVNVPSSAAPAPPVVRDVIPMFMWEQTTEPEHPFAIRRIRRSGVRIWLDRPWNSSGEGRCSRS